MMIVMMMTVMTTMTRRRTTTTTKLRVSQLWHYIETWGFHKDIKNTKDFADDVTYDDDDDDDDDNNDNNNNNDEFGYNNDEFDNFCNFQVIWPFC